MEAAGWPASRKLDVAVTVCDIFIPYCFPVLDAASYIPLLCFHCVSACFFFLL